MFYNPSSLSVTVRGCSDDLVEEVTPSHLVDHTTWCTQTEAQVCYCRDQLCNRDGTEAMAAKYQDYG